MDYLDNATGTILTPSPQGRDCLGNGSWPGYECCCDECDHFPVCFPEYEEELFGKMMQHMAAEEGRRLIEENERLKNDPDAAIPEDLYRKCMELLGG